jgi:hypothetical protein
MDNVIGFPTRASEPTVIEFEIWLDSVDDARRTLECLSAVVEVGLKLCEKTETAGDGLILAGIGRLFAAHAAVAQRARELVPLCSLPRFDRDPDGAA